MKRAIAGKRGSVRGAPPEVFAAFTSFSDDGEADFTDSLEFAKGLVGFLAMIVAGVCLAIFWAFLFEYPPD